MTPEFIVVHHTVTPQLWSRAKTLLNINSAHKNRSFSRGSKGWYIGYHHVIGYDWDEQTRKYDERGVHEPSMNARGIGIALVGDFRYDMPTQYQLRILGQQIDYLQKKYSISKKNILTHKDAKAQYGTGGTACPGTNITYDLIYNSLEIGNMDAQEFANKVTDYVVELNFRGILGGRETEADKAFWGHSRRIEDGSRYEALTQELPHDLTKREGPYGGASEYKHKINSLFQAYLGRDATTEEVRGYSQRNATIAEVAHELITTHDKKYRQNMGIDK